MIRSRLRTSVQLALLAPLLLQGCDSPLPSAPSSPAALQRHAAQEQPAPRLIACPSATGESAVGTIGRNGGTLRLGRHSLTIPAGALARDTRFTLRSPAGMHLTLEISSDDPEWRNFAGQGAVTISYAHCKRQNLWRSPVIAVFAGAETNTRLTYVNGEDDSATGTFTFQVEDAPEGSPLIVARGIYAVAY